MERTKRTEMLLGKEATDKLNNARVAVFGVGGVGSYTVEALARAGIGAIDVIDKDKVDESNINRQLIALYSTLGRDKAEVAKDRILDINPDCRVNAISMFFLPENECDFDFDSYDYVVDAVDNVSAKLSLIKKCKETKTPIICSMGTGNKLNPCGFKVADISKTSVCPLAKIVRTECKKRGYKNVKVVYSEEEPIKTSERTPGSVSFVPSAAGLIIASEVIKDLIK